MAQIDFSVNADVDGEIEGGNETIFRLSSYHIERAECLCKPFQDPGVVIGQNYFATLR